MDNEQHFFAHKVDFLDTDERRQATPPEEILQMIPLQKNDSVLDLGAGTGYFAIPAAKMTTGTIYALDIDPKMLALLSSKAQAERLENIRVIQGSISEIPSSIGQVDIVLTSLILHEVKPLHDVLAQIRRVLKTGGYLLCLEYEKTEATSEGPPMHMRIPFSTLEAELAATGLHVVRKTNFENGVYVLVAKKDT